MTPKPSDRGSPYVAALICGLLLLAVFLAFGQTVGHGFLNYDDHEYIYNNRYVANGLSGEGIAWAFTHTHSNNWHPLSWLSHMFDCQVFGVKSPGGHHLINVILHALTAMGLFLVLRELTGRIWLSGFIAAVFAIHPLRVESVAWISERKDVLSGLFFVLTLAAYVGYVRRPFSIARYMMVVLLFALGLMAKPMLVTLPIVLLLLDYWPLHRFDSLRRVLLEKIPLAALSAASCAITVFAQRDALAASDVLPIPMRITNSIAAYTGYLGHFLYPCNLVVFYPHPGDSLSAWQTLGSVALLIGISVAAIVYARSRPYLLVGWVWYLVMLLPVIGLVQVGLQAMADRYTYLPQIGLCLALACAAVDLSVSWPHRQWIGGVAATAIVMALAVCAWNQTQYWRDSETLWKHATACTEYNYNAHYNLANALCDSKKIDEAIGEYREALKINPQHADSHYNLGNVLNDQKKIDDAIAEYERAIEADPGCVKAHNNLGLALIARGRVKEAIDHYQQAIAIHPLAETHHNMGNALSSQGKIDEAISHYLQALEIQSDLESTCYQLGNMFYRKKQLARAVEFYRRAVELKPDYTQAQDNLCTALIEQNNPREALMHLRAFLRTNPNHLPALILASWTLSTEPDPSIRNANEAVQLAERAVQLTGGHDWNSHDTLAAAYAEAGRFAEAVQTEQQSLELISLSKDRATADMLRARLKLYQAGAPFRQIRAAASSR